MKLLNGKVAILINNASSTNKTKPLILTKNCLHGKIVLNPKAPKNIENSCIGLKFMVFKGCDSNFEVKRSNLKLLQMKHLPCIEQYVLE